MKREIIELGTVFEQPQGDKLLIGKVIAIGDCDYVDIRSHYINESGAKVPTSRGIRIQVGAELDVMFDIGIFDSSFMQAVDKFVRPRG